MKFGYLKFWHRGFVGEIMADFDMKIINNVVQNDNLQEKTEDSVNKIMGGR